jgi:(2Fe-2S) ferredoxin
VPPGDYTVTVEAGGTSQATPLRVEQAQGSPPTLENVTVYPDKVFYSHVTEQDLPAVAAHHRGRGPKVAKLCGKAQPDVEQIIWDMLDSPY